MLPWRGVRLCLSVCPSEYFCRHSKQYIMQTWLNKRMAYMLHVCSRQTVIE